MLKVIRAILISTLILTTLLIVNIFQTKDIIRLQEIEKTDKSFNFYIKESGGVSLASELTFLKQLSHDQKVTIFKTDVINTNTMIKSVIYDANSFPYQAFGLKKTNLFSNLLFNSGNFSSYPIIFCSFVLTSSDSKENDS